MAINSKCALVESDYDELCRFSFLFFTKVDQIRSLPYKARFLSYLSF